MNNDEKVAVIIPTYNRVNLIRGALDSVFKQSYQNWDIIVVDDGSTDNTEEVVKNYSPRVHYFKTKNTGLPAAARNVGIKHSKADYVAFLDSDDIWLPQKLEVQIEHFRKFPEAGLVHSNALHFYKDVHNASSPFWKNDFPPSGNVFKKLFQENFIITSSVLTTRKCLEDIGLFNDDIKFAFCEDYELWLRLAAKYPIISISQPLTLYRDPEPSRQRNTEVELIRLINVLTSIYVNYESLIIPWNVLAKKRIANAYSILGCQALKTNSLRNAHKYFDRAVSYYPGNINYHFFKLLSSIPFLPVEQLLSFRKQLARVLTHL